MQDLERAGLDHQHGRSKDEHIRHHEASDRQAHGRHAGGIRRAADHIGEQAITDIRRGSRIDQGRRISGQPVGVLVLLGLGLLIDFALAIEGGRRFRVNAYYQKGRMATALRAIPASIPSAEDLGLPPTVLSMGTRAHGLLLVVGPTGAGKSTTMACLVDRNGVQGTYVGDLPEQCAAMNRTNINVHLLSLEAVFTRSRAAIYHAAMMDPHTASELTLDEIRSLCDDLIEAHEMQDYFG